jgi:hypothetical protein
MQLNNNIDILQEELDRISQLEIDLRTQKQYKQQQLEIAKASKVVNDNNQEVNNDNHQNFDISHEVLDENESDIQANMYIINMQW